MREDTTPKASTGSGSPEERSRDEIEIPAPKGDPGHRAVDDHVAGEPYGLGHQPTDDLDEGVDDEHLSSPSQGVRPERG